MDRLGRRAASRRLRRSDRRRAYRRHHRPPRQRNRVPRLETRATPSKHSRWMDRQGDLPRPRIARNGYPLQRGDRCPRYRGISAPIQGRLRSEDPRCGLHQRLGKGVASGGRRASSQGLRARQQPHATPNPPRKNTPLDQMAGRASRSERYAQARERISRRSRLERGRYRLSPTALWVDAERGAREEARPKQAGSLHPGECPRPRPRLHQAVERAGARRARDCLSPRYRDCRPCSGAGPKGHVGVEIRDEARPSIRAPVAPRTTADTRRHSRAGKGRGKGSREQIHEGGHR